MTGPITATPYAPACTHSATCVGQDPAEGVDRQAGSAQGGQPGRAERRPVAGLGRGRVDRRDEDVVAPLGDGAVDLVGVVAGSADQGRSRVGKRLGGGRWTAPPRRSRRPR